MKRTECRTAMKVLVKKTIFVDNNLYGSATFSKDPMSSGIIAFTQFEIDDAEQPSEEPTHYTLHIGYSDVDDEL